MEAVVSSRSTRPAWLGLRVGVRLPSTGAWILGFAPVLYLALKGGGYDLVVYSQVGVAVWWIVLCGVLSGVLPAVRIDHVGWLVLGVLFSYAVWTALGATWSSSVERSVDELGRVSAYAGFFVLGLCVLDAGRLRHLLNGMACAFAIVGVLAVLSRLHPQWFPRDEVVAFFGPTARLDYPLNYANGLGEFLAMGMVLLLGTASRARTLAGSALAAACLPVLALGIVLSISRGGALAGVIGLLFLLALLPARIPVLASALTAAGGSAILVVALLQRSALRNGLSTSQAVTQRGEMLVLILVVCAGVALVQSAISLWARFASRPAWMAVPRRRAAIGFAGAVAIAVALATVAGLPGALSRQWRAFKQPKVTGVSSVNAYTRFGTATGSHRYQYWQVAIAAFHTNELHGGIGPGTFEFWWAQHNSVSQFVRNAHSLYIETLAELGIVGALQVVGLFGILLVLGTVRALRAPPSTRHALAVAVAAFAVFAVSAAYDWVWQLAVLPAAALLLGGGGVSVRRRPAQLTRRSRSVTRMVLACGALLALPAIAIPLIMTTSIRFSQSEVRAGNLAAAMQAANSAQALEPYAATPRLQRALILELERRYAPAAAAARQATERESTDWRTWLVRSRIEVEAGHPRLALAYYLHARALNPTSALFSS
jgi:hypothetical protein